MGQQLLSLLLPEEPCRARPRGRGPAQPWCCDRNSPSSEGGGVGTAAPHCLLKELHLQICSLEQHNCILPPAPASGLALPERSNLFTFSVVQKKKKIILSPPQTCITPALLGAVVFPVTERAEEPILATLKGCAAFFSLVYHLSIWLVNHRVNHGILWLKKTNRNKSNISPAPALDHVLESHIHTLRTIPELGTPPFGQKDSKASELQVLILQHVSLAIPRKSWVRAERGAAEGRDWLGRALLPQPACPGCSPSPALLGAGQEAGCSRIKQQLWLHFRKAPKGWFAFPAWGRGSSAQGGGRKG